MLLHLAIAWLMLGFTPPRPAHALPPNYFIPAMGTVDARGFLGPDAPASVAYPKGARIQSSVPLIPVLPWGLRFTADYLVSLENDGEWGMIEIVRIDGPAGATWFALDSRLDGTQVVALPSKNPAAETLASLFPAPFYDAGLEVKRGSTPEGLERIEAAYRRRNGDRVAFQMVVDPTPHPQTFRNGNGMNHSERSALAVIDLESFQLASAFRFTDGSPRRAQSLAGIEIAGLLVQTAAGLMSGSQQQADAHLSRLPATPQRPPLRSRLEARPSIEANSLVLVEKNLLQSTEYAFDLRGEQREIAELRSVRITQALPAGETAAVLEVRFNPSLPDFRYPFASTGRLESRMTLAVAGQEPYGSAVVSIEPGDRPGRHRLGVRGEYPGWVKQRPLLLQLDASHRGPASLQARVLVPGGAPLSDSGADAGPAVSRIDVLQAFSFAWLKRPHRLSALRVRLPDTLSSTDAGLGVLGGGTWANGSAASDTARAKLTTVTLEGADFHRVSTPELPLLQATPGIDEAKVEAVHRLDVRFLQGRLDGVTAPVIFVNGFEFRAGPAHEQTGLTFSGTEFEILDWSIRDSQTLSISVALRQHFAGVPDRAQDFAAYSGLGRLHLVVALPRKGSTFAPIQEFPLGGEKESPTQLFPTDPIDPECLEAQEIAPSAFHSLKFSVLDNDLFPGRYVRKLQASTSRSEEFELFSNAGELSRATRYEVARTVLGLDEVLAEVPGSVRCWSPPAQ